MGGDSDADDQADEDEQVGGRAHRVDIPYDYWMARYPVTVAQYAAFVEAGGYEDQSFWSAEGLSWPSGDWDSRLREDEFRDAETFKAVKEWLARRTPELRGLPMEWEDQVPYWNRSVTGVCWFEAEAYCRWLDRAIRALDGAGWIGGSDLAVRLSTEAEWEKAARAGDKRIYPWGNEPWDENRANAEGVNDKGIGHPSAVGLYPQGATPQGIHDLAGNVWEWAHTVYLGYPYPPDPRDWAARRGGERLVVRGGSWVYLQGYVRCAARGRHFPDYYFDYLGFRVVVSLAAGT